MTKVHEGINRAAAPKGGPNLFGCFFGHNWTQWEQYVQEGRITPIGLLYGPLRGKTFNYSEWRQRRKCRRCGFKQDEKVWG